MYQALVAFIHLSQSPGAIISAQSAPRREGANLNIWRVIFAARRGPIGSYKQSKKEEQKNEDKNL